MADEAEPVVADKLAAATDVEAPSAPVGPYAISCQELDDMNGVRTLAACLPASLRLFHATSYRSRAAAPQPPRRPALRARPPHAPAASPATPRPRPHARGRLACPARRRRAAG